MASAPTPGAQRRQEAANVRFRITVDGVESTLYPASYGPRDDMIMRIATKKPPPQGWGEEFSLQGLLAQLGDVRTIGTDTLCNLWWFGRYKAGENVKLGDCIDVFPGSVEAQERVVVDEVKPDEDDLSPEA